MALGYTGVIFFNDSSIVGAFNGIAWKEINGKTEYRVDPGREFERGILETGPDSIRDLVRF